MTINVPAPSPTVGELVAERPQLGRVFERLGIDYCCGGRKTLAAACAERSLDLLDVRAQLEAVAVDPATSGDPDWTSAPLSLLADHIQSVHHGFLTRELPRMDGIVRKVAAVHGAAHPELAELKRVFAQFAGELTAHVAKEESVVFPWIRALETGTPDVQPSRGPLDGPVRRMMQEHEDAGRALAKMRDLTNGFTPPDGACGTYRVMLSGLRDLEVDMHTHVHKENNILFPRALALEAGGSAATGVRSCCTRSL